MAKNTNFIISLGGTIQNLGGQLGRQLEQYGTNVPEFLAFIARPENGFVIRDLAKNAERMPQAVVEPQPWSKPPLLVALLKITVAATEAFDVAAHFKKNLSPDAEVTIAYVDSSVENDITGLVEPAQPATDIYRYRAIRGFEYSEARQELGGDKIVRTIWAKLYELLKQQPKGPKSKKGALLTGGEANLFEIENANGVPRLVSVDWRDWLDELGWYFYSYSVAYRDEWYEYRRVFSGNPLPVAA